MNTDSLHDLLHEQFTARFDDADSQLWSSCMNQACRQSTFARAVLRGQGAGSGLLLAHQWKLLDDRLREPNLDPLEFLLWAFEEPRLWLATVSGPGRPR